MSEYIIKWSGIGGQLARLLNDNVPLVLWPKKIREERQREEVVRCRDCKHYDRMNDDEGMCMVPDDDGDYARRMVDAVGYCYLGERRGE